MVAKHCCRLELIVVQPKGTRHTPASFAKFSCSIECNCPPIASTGLRTSSINQKRWTVAGVPMVIKFPCPAFGEGPWYKHDQLVLHQYFRFCEIPSNLSLSISFYIRNRDSYTICVSYCQYNDSKVPGWETVRWQISSNGVLLQLYCF